MKKYIFISILAVVSLASCKKDYSCTCTQTYTQDGQVDTYILTSSIAGATKAEATAACNESTLNYTDTEDGYNYTEKCDLSK